MPLHQNISQCTYNSALSRLLGMPHIYGCRPSKFSYFYVAVIFSTIVLGVIRHPQLAKIRWPNVGLMLYKVGLTSDSDVGPTFICLYEPTLAWRQDEMTLGQGLKLTLINIKYHFTLMWSTLLKRWLSRIIILETASSFSICISP